MLEDKQNILTRRMSFSFALLLFAGESHPTDNAIPNALRSATIVAQTRENVIVRCQYQYIFTAIFTTGCVKNKNICMHIMRCSLISSLESGWGSVCDSNFSITPGNICGASLHIDLPCLIIISFWQKNPDIYPNHGLTLIKIVTIWKYLAE